MRVRLMIFAGVLALLLGAALLAYGIYEALQPQTDLCAPGNSDCGAPPASKTAQ